MSRIRWISALWAIAIATALFGAPAPGLASSHSEAPGTAKDRLADDTDLYAFVSRDASKAVTFVGNWIPLLEPNGGPNFYSFDDQAAYYINIDNVGDCLDHIRYEFKFTTTRRTGATFLYNTGVVTSLTDPDLNVFQTATITRYDDGVATVLATNVPVAPNFVGPVSMPDYESLANQAITDLPDGSKVFLGPRDDPFFVDLAAVFDLLTIRRVPGDRGRGVDGVGGFNCMTIALQVPMTQLTRDGLPPNEKNSILGIYDSAERPMSRTLNGDGTVSVNGQPVQVSRLGHPLVNEVVIALQDKDRFNATKPTGDGAFLSYVTNPELPGLLDLIYGISVPPTPRNDLVTVFLTGVPGLNQPAGGTPCEMLRLNMAIPPSQRPKRLGVLAGDNAGFPNGRRLADDVVDIAERVVAGVLVPGFNIEPNNRLGDGVNVNDKPFMDCFPYVAPPHNPFDHEHHREERGRNLAGDPGDGEDSAAAEKLGGEDTAALAKAGASGPALMLASAPGGKASLEYSIDAPARVSLKIYDVQGRLVRTLVDQDAAQGTFRALWDGRSTSGAVAGNGVYFARFVASDRVVETKKIVIGR
jgi:Domain of unknown function (DUF4331)/FlgD Ig-like domain